MIKRIRRKIKERIGMNLKGISLLIVIRDFIIKIIDSKIRI
jgi:hypothetical protein